MSCKVAFYKGLSAPGKDWTDWFICKWTKGPYSHVELVIGDYMYSTSPRDGKVRIKKHFYDEKTWDYVEIENTDINRIKKFYLMTEGENIMSPEKSTKLVC